MTTTYDRETEISIADDEYRALFRAEAEAEAEWLHALHHPFLFADPQESAFLAFCAWEQAKVNTARAREALDALNAQQPQPRPQTHDDAIFQVLADRALPPR